jgi:multicomponent Na+:H+ antiporter subunit D
MIESLSPAFILLAGAGAVAAVPARLRPAVFVIVAALALGQAVTLPLGATVTVDFAGFDLVLLSVDRLNRIFGIIFTLIGMIAGVYAWHVRNRAEPVAAMLYGAGALGVTYAGDFVTLLIWWEIMAVSSTVLVYARGTDEARSAAYRYLMVHLVGGTVLLGGIAWHFAEYRQVLLGPLDPAVGASWLILAGVALNAAIPPLHPWLPDAYPRASVTGAIFMSALTTKSAVYVLMRLFPGWEILVWAGVIMALYGVVYAVLANDIRQILAYHIVSQVGYMVAGVGLGTAISLNGTAAHAYSHILYKALLFMGAGVVLHTTGRSKLTELGGLGRHMPATLWLFMIGAFSISGFPLFNGFVSKSMIVSAAGLSHRDAVMLLLFLASVGTFLHTGLKIPVFTFWGRDAGLRPDRAPRNMIAAMVVVAALCMFYGMYPPALYRLLPYEAVYHPYTIPHLVETVQLLIFTFVAFWMFRDKLAGEPFLAADTDWAYRRGLRGLGRLSLDVVNTTFGAAARLRDRLVQIVVVFAVNPLRPSWREASPYDEHAQRPALSGPLAATLGFFLLLAGYVVLRH